MSVQEGTRILVVAALLVGLPALAAAQDADEDIDLDSVETLAEDAATLQSQAIAAAVDERWVIAADKARAALTLDTSVRTAQSRLVLARALEALDELESALHEVDIYLALPLLERDKAKGDSTRERIVGRLRARDRAEADAREAERRRAARSTVPTGVRQRQYGGIGLMAGGAVPTILGVWFVGTDLNYASRGIESGTWGAIGAPLLITGLTLEAVGAVVLATNRRPARSARLHLQPIVAPDPQGGVQAGITGRF